MMRRGTCLEVEIEKAVFRGLGLARHDGQVVLVRGGYPGERWQVRVTEPGRQYLRAEVEQPIRTIPQRRASACTVFPECGGCAYQDLEYAEQQALKQAVLIDTLARARAPRPEQISVLASPEQGWRTRASLHVETRRDGVHLGLTAAGSRRVIDFDTCVQLSAPTNDVVRDLREALRGDRTLAAKVERVELAESQDTAVRAAVLSGGLTARDLPRLHALAARVPGLAGLGALLPAESRMRFVRIKGDTHVSARVGQDELRAHVLSFFQANRYLLESLVNEVAAGVADGARILDLYGGVGLFSVPLARRAEQVVCVEIDRFAAEDARANAERAGRSNMRVLRGDVRYGLDAEPTSHSEYIVLDPPRTGLDEEVVRRVSERRPAGLVYVSCDPPTMGRDLARFAAAGYRSVRMISLDMFPDTFHLETIAHLESCG